jgi:hypothetical protein
MIRAKRGCLRNRRSARRGLVVLEAMIVLAVAFTLAMIFYYLAQDACGNLHDIVSGAIGSPYL